MFHILVVDDEEVICESLKLKIKTIDSFSMSVIYEANSGLAALDILNQYEIDIVLTDIKMPNMDGIELIRKMNENNYKAKVIVLSGYDDYSYVRESFQMGAIDYILKPASIEELKEKMEIAIARIQQDNVSGGDEVQRKNKEIHEKIKEYLYDQEHLTEEINSILPYKFTHMVIQNFSFNETINVYMANKSVEQVWEKYYLLLKEKDICSNLFYVEDGRLMMIFNYEVSNLGEFILKLLNQYMLELKAELRGHSMLASSNTIQSKKALFILYQQVLKALKYRIVYPDFSIILYNDIMENKNCLPIITKKELTMLSQEDITLGLQQMNELIERYLSHDKLGCQTIDTIEQLYETIMSRIFYMKEILLLSDKVRYRRDFYSFNTITELKIYIKEEIYEIKLLAVENSKREKTISEVAQKYIKENYNKNIDMAVIANMVSMNYTYFSELFKKETGMNFRDYIMQVRMEEAKRQLMDPTNKIKEVAFNVGYDSPKHFARAFKNHCGQSPKDYRK